MSTTYRRQELEALVPHRGANILPDTLVVAPDGESSSSTVQLGPDDERCIFGREDGAGGHSWLEPFLGEFMALTGVPLLSGDLAAAGRVSVFSMVSRCSFSGDAPLHGTIEGRARITRRRGDFTQFACSVLHGDRELMTAEVMSGAAALADIAAGTAQPLTEDTGEQVRPFLWKHPRLTFADRITAMDVDAGTLTASYTYPVDHPFVPTHFPGAPLMMGVTQWAAVADAAWLLAERRQVDAITVDGQITRPDGSDVIDVRGLQMQAGPGGVPRIRGSKRVAFRDVVRPNDGILISVQAVG
ncbi:MAG: hypothetical protein ACOCXJ_04390 [Planctomycetota bacterium]